MLESPFNKVAGNFIKQRLQNRCLLVNIAKFLRTSILKNICEQAASDFSEPLQSLKGKGQEVTLYKSNLKFSVQEHHFVYFFVFLCIFLK